MTDRRRNIEANPGRYDLFALLRAIERGSPDQPRIGKSQVLSQDLVRLEQRPYLAFPDSNLQSADFDTDGPPHVEAAVLGYFGPQGALPLLMTDEVLEWYNNGDDSFVRFANLFATRFLQLFYRAWADSRPIAHADRAEADRFLAWVGATIGIGTPATRARGVVPDRMKIRHAGLLASRVKSASRLQQTIRSMLDVDVSVRERTGMWLEFEPDDRTRLGRKGAVLGRSSHAGARVYSINHKAILELRTRDLDAYRRFLPGGHGHRELRDLVGFFLGCTVDVDVRLALPASCRPPVRLGRSGHLGWTAWTAPKPPPPGEPDYFVADATFRLTGAAA